MSFTQGGSSGGSEAVHGGLGGKQELSFDGKDGIHTAHCTGVRCIGSGAHKAEVVRFAKTAPESRAVHS